MVLAPKRGLNPSTRSPPGHRPERGPASLHLDPQAYVSWVLQTLGTAPLPSPHDLTLCTLAPAP